MMPHPAAPNAAGVVQSCPDLQQTRGLTAAPLLWMSVRYGGGVDHMQAAVTRCLADVIHSHSGTKVFI